MVGGLPVGVVIWVSSWGSRSGSGDLRFLDTAAGIVGDFGALGDFKIGNVYRHSDKNGDGGVLKQIKRGVGTKSRRVCGCADSAFGWSKMM